MSAPRFVVLDPRTGVRSRVRIGRAREVARVNPALIVEVAPGYRVEGRRVVVARARPRASAGAGPSRGVDVGRLATVARAATSTRSRGRRVQQPPPQPPQPPRRSQRNRSRIDMVTVTLYQRAGEPYEPVLSDYGPLDTLEGVRAATDALAAAMQGNRGRNILEYWQQALDAGRVRIIDGRPVVAVRTDAIVPVRRGALMNNEPVVVGPGDFLDEDFGATVETYAISAAVWAIATQREPLNSATALHRNLAQRVLGNRAPMLNTRYTPLQEAAASLAPGNCFKDSVVAVLERTTKNPRAVKAALNRVRKWPDGPVTLEQGLELCAADVTDTLVLDAHEAVVAFRRTPRKTKAPGRLVLLLHDGHVCPVLNPKLTLKIELPPEDFIASNVSVPKLKAPEELRDPVPVTTDQSVLEFASRDDLRSIEPGVYAVPDIRPVLDALADVEVPCRVWSERGEVRRVDLVAKAPDKIITIRQTRPIGDANRLLDHQLRAYRDGRNRLDPVVRSRAARGEWSNSVSEVFDKLVKTAMTARLPCDVDGPAWALDVNKLYSHVLANMERVPVLTAADELVELKKRPGELEPDTWYLVEPLDLSTAWAEIYFRGTTSLCLGRNLARLNARVKFLGMLRPSYVAPMRAAPVVRELYADQDPAVAKQVVNHAIGIAGRQVTSNSRSELYTMRDWAVMRKRECPGSKIYRLTPRLYVVEHRVERRVLNGWRNTTWATLHEDAAFEMAMRARAFDRVIAIKTDCLFVPATERVPAGSATIGEFKPPELVDHWPGRMWEPVTWRPVVCPPRAWRHVDEIPEDGNVMIGARFPGSGKTWTLTKYIRDHGLEEKTIVLAQQNSTLEEFRRLLPGCRCYATTTAWYRLEVFDIRARCPLAKDKLGSDTVLVLEEAGLFPVQVLRKLVEESQRRSWRLLGTYDLKQLPPVRDALYSEELAERHLIAAFERRLFLDRNRTLPEHQMPRLEELEAAVDAGDRDRCVAIVKSWNPGVPIEDVLEGRAPGLRLSYLNILGSMATNRLAELVPGSVWTWRGSLAGVKNARYRVRAVGDKVHAENTVTGEALVVDRRTWLHSTEDENSVTIYSCQGTRTSGDVLLMDIDSELMTPAAIWMAVTRARDLDRVRWVSGTSELLRDLDARLRRKINGYREQDRRAGRRRGDLTVAGARRILTRARCRCQTCGIALVDDWVFDRIDNLEPHDEDNLRLSCVSCNADTSDERGRQWRSSFCPGRPPSRASSPPG